jgi:hypothetical protein
MFTLLLTHFIARIIRIKYNREKKIDSIILEYIFYQFFLVYLNRHELWKKRINKTAQIQNQNSALQIWIKTSRPSPIRDCVWYICLMAHNWLWLYFNPQNINFFLKSLRHKKIFSLILINFYLRYYVKIIKTSIKNY